MTDVNEAIEPEVENQAAESHEEPRTAPSEGDPMGAQPEETEPDTFPRSYVTELRQENGKYRQRAQQADTYARRLHTELVRAAGRLADPTDLPFNETHLEDPDALAAAVDELLAAKPHLASRRPVGDIGQGNRGVASEPFSLLGMLKERT